MLTSKNKDIVLKEWETTPDTYFFPWEEASYLQNYFNKEILLTPSLHKEHYQLTARQYIGSIIVNGREITIRPKIDNSNIMYMLSYAWGLPKFPEGMAGYRETGEIFEFIIYLFTQWLENLLARGLYKSYKEIEENLGFVKGRLIVNETLRQNPGLRHMNVCRYSDFTEDILENQILKYTIGLLLARRYRNDYIRQRLYRCYMQMEQVSYRPILVQDFKKIVYTRLNGHYKKIHNLCSLFINSTSFSNEKGTIRFTSFLLDMNKLFEEFVGNYLKEQLETLPGIKVHLQKTEYLDKHRKIRMRPDIVIIKNKRPVLVLDTKYKRLDVGQIKHADIYQMYAYCSTLRVAKGLLIYGEGEGAEYLAKVPEDGLGIESYVLKSGGDITQFRNECSMLGNHIAKSVFQSF